jgi:hypothetical protein
MAESYRKQLRIAEAAELQKRAIGIFEKTLGSEHPYLPVALRAHAALLRSSRRKAEAGKLEKRANEIVAAITRQDPTSTMVVNLRDLTK